MSDELDLVQYYLVDTTLKMRKGEIAAQVAHGAVYSMISYYGNPYHLYGCWMNGPLMKKIILGADQELMSQACQKYPLAIEVFDAGLTEVDPGTRTVVVLPVMEKTNAPDWIQRLKLL